MTSISLQNRWEIFTKVVDEGRSRTRRRRKVCLLNTLPLDVMAIILGKLGAIEVMRLGELGVCSSWRKLSNDPRVYRRIDLRDHWQSPRSDELIRMAMVAVKKSNGQVDEFSIADYNGDDLLNYVLDNSYPNSIRRLRFVKCPGLTDDMLLEFARKFSCLEEVELSYCCNSLEAIAEVGRLCPKLQCFRLIANQDRDVVDRAAGASVVTKTMPKLRGLHLGSYRIGTKELHAILDGCPYLEHLDLRRCYIYGDFELRKICDGRIRCLRLDNDLVDDPDDYVLTRCEYYAKWRFEDYAEWRCDCRCGSFFAVEDDNFLDNMIFLPPKATAYYL